MILLAIPLALVVAYFTAAEVIGLAGTLFTDPASVLGAYLVPVLVILAAFAYFGVLQAVLAVAEWRAEKRRAQRA